MDFRKRYAAVILLIPIILGAWLLPPRETLLTRALKDIKAPLTVTGERFALYEAALNDAIAYVEAANGSKPALLTSARKSCADAIAGIAALKTPESALTKNDRAGLVKLGVNAVDYDVLFQYADFYKRENIRSLTLLSYYLNGAPGLNGALSYVAGYMTRYQELERKILYAGVNHLFCGLVAEDADELCYLNPDGQPWDADRAAIEAKVDFWFSEMEEEIAAFAEFVGGQYEAMLEEAAALTERLIEAGYSTEEAEQTAAAITELCGNEVQEE
jgi:hypothetical protein